MAQGSICSAVWAVWSITVITPFSLYHRNSLHRQVMVLFGPRMSIIWSSNVQGASQSKFQSPKWCWALDYEAPWSQRILYPKANAGTGIPQLPLPLCWSPQWLGKPAPTLIYIMSILSNSSPKWKLKIYEPQNLNLRTSKFKVQPRTLKRWQQVPWGP